LWLRGTPLSSLPGSGYPLAFAAVAVAWYGSLLPTSCYEHSWEGKAVLWKSAALLLLTDLLQWAAHAAIHSRLLGRSVYEAHARHHAHVRPSPVDAFDTGHLDALVQLLLPVWASVSLVRPDRTSLVLFGAFYSHWLLFIHSSPTRFDPVLERLGLVSPSLHAEHHVRPETNLSHLVRWDAALGPTLEEERRRRRKREGVK